MTPPTLTISLVNKTRSSNVYAYIAGRALEKNNAVFLLKRDGKTPYFPPNPPAGTTCQPLGEDCGIQLGKPGTVTKVTIPRVAGGRINFSIDAPLTFLLNPGGDGNPALVEPSVTNPGDPNINANWGFCEFTFNQDQLYANISYVDFVSIPISLTLTTTGGGEPQRVAGMPADGLERVCTALEEQDKKDGAGWSKLIYKGPDGRPLRVLSPNLGRVFDPNLFEHYYDPYIEKVWERYSSAKLTVDTQASYGALAASVDGEKMCFNNGCHFDKPNTAHIFSCNTGPFANTAEAHGPLCARLGAAWNRSTLLLNDNHPDGEDPKSYYNEDITNHYSRVVHEVNIDGKGYAFPYDDVKPGTGEDQSGEVHAGDPAEWVVTVGAD